MQQILVADRQELVLLGLCRLIDDLPGARVVGRARSGSETLRIAQATRPDLVILDVDLEGINGIDTTRRIRTSLTKPRCCAWRSARTPSSSPPLWTPEPTATPSRARPQVSFAKRSGPTLARETYLSPAVTASLAEALKAPRAPRASAFSLLTEREREILQLLAEGTLRERACGSALPQHQDDPHPSQQHHEEAPHTPVRQPREIRHLRRLDLGSSAEFAT